MKTTPRPARSRPKRKAAASRNTTDAPRAKAPVARTRDARGAALQLINSALRQGRAIDDAFDTAANGLEDRDRAFARLLTATTLRRLGQIDAVLNTFLEREPPALTLDVLRISAAQILFIGTPVHAAVATGVETIKRSPQTKFSGLVNAVLRRVADHGPAMVAQQNAGDLNTPSWLRQRWAAHYGDSTADLVGRAHLSEAPVDLTLKDDTTAAQWATALKGEVLPTGSVRLGDAGRIEALPGFDEGAWWVQDAAAALPARILLQALGESHGKRVADLCAAPGGKTMQLAAAGCVVTAVDTSAKRLERVRENLARVQMKAEVVNADVMTWQPAEPLDGILLDAPCSSTGTIRRHPDLPYIKSADDVKRLAIRQREMLKAAAGLLKPNGVLVYSVCSLEKDEGEDVVEAVLADESSLVHEPVPASVLGGALEFLNSRCDLRTLPSHWSSRGGTDGFYAALLRKRG
jgi:16S rRNA (cytosine967-C5)-methyltransferase